MKIGVTPDGEKRIRNFGPLSRSECLSALNARGEIDLGKEAESLVPIYAYLTDKQFGECVTYWQGRCAICDIIFTSEIKPVQDHWIPRSAKCFPGSEPTNIVPLCTPCNANKAGSDPLLWLVEKLGHWRGMEKMSEIIDYIEWWRDKLYGNSQDR